MRRRWRLLVGLVPVLWGLSLALPLLLPLLMQEAIAGRLVAVYPEPMDDGRQVLGVLFRYRSESSEAVRIHLGHHLAGPTGEPITAPIFEPEAMATLVRRIEAAGGAEELPAQVFTGGGPPRVYSPILSRQASPWPRAVLLMGIPIILMLSHLLHQGLTECRRPPRR